MDEAKDRVDGSLPEGGLLRVIDANINRAAEGLRVLEDIARFVHQEKAAAKRLRELRHLVRKTWDPEELVLSREPAEDPGRANSQESCLDQRSSDGTVITANFKRAQEAVRSIEEGLKALGRMKEAKAFEEIRFEIYEAEKRSRRWFDERRALLRGGGIYFITGEAHGKGKTTLECVQGMLQAGARIIQYREKDKDGRTKVRECREIRRLTREAGCLFIVNDDVALAQIVDADGIHLGQEDMPIEAVRPLVGEKMLIGVSTHNPDQAMEAVRKGADYIGVGPTFPTRTKPGVEPSEGLAYLEWVAENIDLPRVSIGGISRENLFQVKACGGQWFAMISEIVGAEDIPERVAELERLLQK